MANPPALAGGCSVDHYRDAQHKDSNIQPLNVLSS